MCSEINKDGNIFDWDGEEVDALELVRCLGLDHALDGDPTSLLSAAAILNSILAGGQVNIDPDVEKVLSGWLNEELNIEECIGGRFDGRWVFVPPPRH